MTFSEFMLADGKENLVEYMKSLKKIKEIPKIFEEQLIEQLKKYYIIGGMSEVVNSWVNDKDIERVNYLQKNILLAYKDDFSKHLMTNEAVKVAIVWDGIPLDVGLLRRMTDLDSNIIIEGNRLFEEFKGSFT